MAKNAKREAARRELLRLLEGLEFYRVWRISCIKMVKGTVLQEDLNEIVEPSMVFLEEFDNAGGQYNQILRAVKQWYSFTYSDFCYLMNAGNEAGSAGIRQFLKDFRDEVGFDFQSEAGLVAETMRKALKIGRISKEIDYFVLKELEDAADHAIMGGRERAQVFAMLRDFEAR